MKKSAKITLVLISSISLLATGCGTQQATKREMYQNKEDCTQEWGSSANCQPTNPSDPFSYYMGPDYYISKGRVLYIPPGTDREEILGTNTGFFMAHRQDIAATQQQSTSGSYTGNSGNWNYSSNSSSTSSDEQVKSKSLGQISTTRTIVRGGFGKSGSIFGRSS